MRCNKLASLQKWLESNRLKAILGFLLTIIPLAAYGSPEEPTKLSPPEGAINVEEIRLTDVNAYQTYFMMQVPYPAKPAVANYSKIMGKPWIRCDWIPEWQSFLDATVSPNRTVHQQAYIWVNRPMRRTLMIASRYYSSANCVGNPENDKQHIFMVEYFNVSIQEYISALKLQVSGG